MGFENHKSHNSGNFKTPNLGVPGQNDIWVLGLWLGIENTVRGKVVASPKFGLWWVLWVHAPKVFQLRTNQLIIWFVQVCVNSWLACQFLSPHLGAPTRPSTPEVLRTRECAPTLSPSIVLTFRLAVESIKELEGVSTHINHTISKIWLHDSQPILQMNKLFTSFSTHNFNDLIQNSWHFWDFQMVRILFHLEEHW
jgi:hypothetical protein